MRSRPISPSCTRALGRSRAALAAALAAAPAAALAVAPLATLLAADPASARTDVFQSLAYEDGHISGGAVFIDVNDTLFVALVLEDSAFSVVRRAAFEYDLTGVPSGAQVVAVSWRIQTSSESGEFDVHGYTGDGSITAEDATVPENVVGSFSGGVYGIRNLALDAAWMQALLDAHSPFAGLMVRGRLGFDSSLQISTKEISSADARAARLTVEYLATSTGATGDDVAAVPGVALLPNTPNPFNPITTLRFQLAEPARTRLGIYDAAGRLVRVLLDAPLEAGSHALVWDGRGAHGKVVAGGTYLQVLQTPDRRTSRALVLLK